MRGEGERHSAQGGRRGGKSAVGVRREANRVSAFKTRGGTFFGLVELIGEEIELLLVLYGARLWE